MNNKTQLTAVSAVVVIAAIVGVGSYFMLAKGEHRGQQVKVVNGEKFGWKYPIAKFPITGANSNQLAYSDIRDPGGIPEGLPVRLKIPVIGVDSVIEDALITTDGRMDVPAGSQNVAWFALGPHPGQIGSAVIGGHFGIDRGVPFVFYNLDKLKVGNKIYIVDDKDVTLAFVIRSIKSFDRNADATTVFTSTDGLIHLNLITCEGVWNQVNGTYPQRLVIFTDAIPGEDAARAIALFPRLLSFGAHGADVAVLQSALEQIGLLTMPPGVIKGYFGLLTRAGVAKYQTSVGLTADGVFGPETKAQLIPAPAPVAVKPTFPSTAIITPEQTLAFPQMLVESLKSLFETPWDGLVTVLLFVSVIFAIFIIIRL